jgi:membrane-associated phospholipid phosphatase
VARARRRVDLPPGVSGALAVSVPVATAAALPRGRLRAAAVWGAHMWAYKILYELPYDRPEALRDRLHVDAPIAVDEALAGGVPATERWQRRFRHPPRLTWLDRALTGIYVLWELEPHVALAWILLRHGERFPAAAVRLGLTYDATLVGYVLAPTAPPWWAGEREGRMDRAVRRVTAEVIKDVRGRPRPGTDHNVGSNPWAAMPSDHTASSVAVALLLWEIDRRAGAVAGGYAVLLVIALVATGEHYVVDVAAGATLAAAIHVATEPLAGPRGGTYSTLLGSSDERRRWVDGLRAVRRAGAPAERGARVRRRGARAVGRRLGPR